VRRSEVGMRKGEKIDGEKVGRSEGEKVGTRTRRRPIRQDYAAAKDAEVGKEGRKAQGSR
jgi:hypothetical protein